MANTSRNFVGGKMNKVLDERVVPNGEYIDALNIRMGSTENSEIGVIENTKGNDRLTTLTYVDGTPLSSDAICIGAIDDSSNETLYWFVHDPSFTVGATGKLDLIVSFNTNTNILTYHIVSVDDGSGLRTTLNFDPNYLITGVNKVDDIVFFTDDFNQPRFFNIRRYYPVPSLNIDVFTEESILVVKKPPTESPSIEPIDVVGQENFLNERFICFAYRYRYQDGEYSATSQWSEPSFVPQFFDYERDTFLNKGMINSYNGCLITYNTGGPLVVGVDLLFKETDSNVIKVIEKLDKAVLGIADNVNATYTFSNSKIYTILPESELLRLYDNVPLQAKAQAVMGNRLMYGNYVEGYDMKDSNGNPVNLEYQSNLISEEINNRFLNDTKQNGNYNIDVPTVVQESVLKVDVSSIPSGSLKANGILTIYIRAEIESTSPVTSATGTFDFTFVYQLPDDYVDFASLVADQSFQDAVGTTSNIQPISLACSNGITFTDLFNCNATNSITYLSQAHVKHRSGISQLDEPILTYVIGSDLYIQIPAIEYVDNPANITSTLYGYFKIATAEVTYQEYGIASSLHSNRDYDIGIVYMDDYNRSTTALVSPNNTVYVPCGNSDLKNTIQVTIPTTQIAPSWATRYKFVVKPNAEGYETIYTNIFYPEPSANEFVWFLLEGENAKKVEVGDRYIVKADSNGPMATCAYATVLDKNVFGTGFFAAGSPNGVYMKILPSEFIAESPTNATFYRTNSDGAGYNDNPIGDSYPFTNIDISAAALPPDTNGYQIPSGTKVKFRVEHRRKGVGNACEARNQDYEGNFVANFDYVTFKDFFDNNIAQTLNIAPYKSCYNSACSDNQYNPNMFTGLTYSSPFNIQVNYFQFQEDGAGNPIKIWVTGTKACSPNNSDRRKAYVYVYLTIIRGGVPIIFETLPKDSNPDIYYENHLSFPINSLGEHQGNVQNQVFSTGQSAIVNTEFFNCYAFGNGAESYKIRDSIIGRQLTLGNRVTSVSAQDYKRADRYADITYSGIYNSESNVNKLNEFNLGLLNYKPLEDSFGPIYKMDGRETDVLVLQEDKISYVLAGKNLLSDAAAGGAITSIPEVLGTQIARVEKYGISFNPESYVQWGYDRYFTDAKRGAVLQLKGGSYSSDQLQVVSEFGMRTWFRDMFLGAFSTQKLGGFDPYMNEYVLSSNEREVVENIECVDCGLQQTFILSGNETEVLNYCINLLQQIGLVTVTWTVFSASTDPSDGFELSVTYNGTTYSSGATTTSGLFSFQKDLIDVDTADLSITMNGDFVLGVVVSCPAQQELNIVEIVLTNNIDSGDATYAQYRYTNGTYSSPLQSRFVTFASGTGSPLVSWYNVVTGAVGTGGFPPAGSNMRMFNNKIPPLATFDFNTLDDKFKYYRSNTSYGNNPVDLNTLLSLASNAVPILGSSPVHYADFIVPPTGNYLYLIWDYRASTTNLLCYGSDSSESCCSCESCDINDCVTVELVNNSEQFYAAVTFNGGLCDEGTPFSVELEPAETASICVINSSPLYSVVFGNPTVNVLSCSCGVDSCYYYFVINSCNEPQVASTNFAGWTIDGADFATNYQAILSGYGVNASNMTNLGVFNVPFTNQGVVVWFKGITPPPIYVGFIADSLGNPINYTWSSAKCDDACWKLNYSTLGAPSNNVAYLDSIGLQMVGGFSIASQIDCLATFGSYLNASNPSDMTTLQTYLRSIYGNQVSVYSVDNGTGYYDIYVNNVYDFGGWQFVSDFTGISQNSRWLGVTTVCAIPPNCQPDPVDYSGIYHNWTGLSYDWTYVTQQIVGTNYPIDILVQVSGGPYCSATAPNDMILYYRRDVTPPPYAITTPNTSPSTQGFTAITFTSGSSAAQTIPSVLPNEYITFAVISLTPPLCSSSANPSIFNVVLRNADAGCLGDVITTFTAKSCINLSGFGPCP